MSFSVSAFISQTSESRYLIDSLSHLFSQPPPGPGHTFIPQRLQLPLRGELPRLSSHPRMSDSQALLPIHLNHFLIIVSSHFTFVIKFLFHCTTQPPESSLFYLLISLCNLLHSSPHGHQVQAHITSCQNHCHPHSAPMTSRSPILMSSNFSAA